MLPFWQYTHLSTEIQDSVMDQAPTSKLCVHMRWEWVPLPHLTHLGFLSPWDLVAVVVINELVLTDQIR